jgi:hypothetical protein
MHISTYTHTGINIHTHTCSSLRPRRQISKIAQAYANVGINEWSLIDQLCTSAYMKLSGDFEPVCTANMLDALSKLNIEVCGVVGESQGSRP